MAKPQKRLVVDGIDFSRVFQFHRIFRAVTMALHPPRLALALLMVVTVVAVGSTWDSLTTPRVHPLGLESGVWSDQDARLSQNLLREAVRRHVPEEHWPQGGEPETWEPLEARDVKAVLTRHGTAAIASSPVAAGPEGGPEGGGIDPARVRALYEQTIQRIEGVRPRGPFEAAAMFTVRAFTRIVDGCLQLQPREVWGGIMDLVVRLPALLWSHSRWFTILFGLLVLLVIALGGGALSRMAAVDFAYGEKLRLRDAIDFASSNIRDLVLALVFSGILVLAIGLVLAIVGAVLFNVPWLDVLGGLLYGLSLLAGLAAAIILVAYVAGFWLLLPAIACEHCDAPDAQQRAMAYVLRRPAHLVGYGIVAIIGLVVAYLIASFIAGLAMQLTATFVGAWTDHDAIRSAALAQFDSTPHDSTHARWTGGLLGFWHTALLRTVQAYLVSYCFAAATIVYLLMRRATDGQDPEEVWRPGYIPGTLAATPLELERHRLVEAMQREAANADDEHQSHDEQ
jgi:hypothetical protein